MAKVSVSPFFAGISIGTISALNFPPVMAAPVFCWLSAANSSCSWREMLYLAEMFSAVMPMWTNVIGQVSPSAIMESRSSSCPMRTPKRAFFRR